MASDQLCGSECEEPRSDLKGDLADSRDVPLKLTLVLPSRDLGRRSPDVGGSRPLRAILTKIELDAIAFAQVVDALTVDGAGMEEHFLAGRISDEAEAFVCSQRLDRSCHRVGSTSQSNAVALRASADDFSRGTQAKDLVAGGGFEPPTFGL